MVIKSQEFVLILDRQSDDGGGGGGAASNNDDGVERENLCRMLRWISSVETIPR